MPTAKESHGIAGYFDNHCRCDICTTAALEYQRLWRSQNPEKVVGQNDRAKQRRRLRRDSARIARGAAPIWDSWTIQTGSRDRGVQDIEHMRTILNYLTERSSA